MPRLWGQKFPWPTCVLPWSEHDHLIIYWRYFNITVVTKAGINYEPDVELFEFG